MSTVSEAVSKAIKVRDLVWSGHLPVETCRIARDTVIIRDGCRFEVVTRPIESGETASSRAFFDEKEQKYVCQWNDNEIFNRSNFALAHALGHVVLGHVKNPAVIKQTYTFSLKSENLEDRAATAFAMELLLPARLVRFLFGGAKNVQELAEAFGVSTTAITHRIRELRLI
jgi:Zn-dependent peptidase ImmA (M78 family)